MSLPTSRFEVPSWHVVFGRPIFFTTEITEILGSFFGFPFSVFLLVGKTNRSTSPLNKNYFYVLGIWSSENLGRQSWNLSFFILEAIQPAKTGLWAMRRGSQQSHFGGHESCSWLFGDNLNKKSSGNRYQHRELGTTPLFRKRCLVNASTSSNSSFSSNKNLLVFFCQKINSLFGHENHGFHMVSPPQKKGHRFRSTGNFRRFRRRFWPRVSNDTCWMEIDWSWTLAKLGILRMAWMAWGMGKNLGPKGFFFVRVGGGSGIIILLSGQRTRAMAWKTCPDFQEGIHL